MRVLIIKPYGVSTIYETNEKYLLRAGHDALGRDLFLRYFEMTHGNFIVYDDDAAYKGQKANILNFCGPIMITKVIDSDENDLIIGDLTDDTITEFLRLCKE